MRESTFISQNLEKWRSYEDLLNQKQVDPTRLSELFVHITDDLSYANTYYPNRSVRVYLNGLAQRIHLRIQQKQRPKLDQFLDFWATELPLQVYANRRSFLISFLLFVGAFLIGVLSASQDPSFYSVVLGQDYVDMTEEFIASGDPMAVYKQRGAFSMTLGIAANNLYVSFLSFILGIFYAIGTVIVLISNGVMVGAFQYFFIERDLFLESFLTIWTHGTLEISAIIIAGAAGLILGNGIVNPGTYHRLQSIQMAFRQSLKVMLGITPIIVLAAIIESYLTRFTETPMPIRLGFILLCLAFVIGYFVIYPRVLYRRGFRLEAVPPTLSTLSADPIKETVIPTNIELLIRSMQSFIQHIGLWVRWSGVGALVYAVVMIIAFGGALDQVVIEDNIFQGFITLVPASVLIADAGILISLLACGYAMIAFMAFRQTTPLYQKEGENDSKDIRKVVFLAIPILLILGLSLVRDSIVPFLMYLTMPIILLWSFALYLRVGHALRAGGHVIEFVFPAFGRALFLFLILYVIGYLPILFVHSTVVDLLTSVFSWIFPAEGIALDLFESFFWLWIEQFFLFLFFGLLCVATVHLYFVLRELKEAPAMKRSVDTLLGISPEGK